MRSRGRSAMVLVLVAAMATAMVAVGIPPGSVTGAAAEDFGPAGTMMLGLEEGAAAGTSTELVGWGLSAIGVDNQQDAQMAEIADELDVISGQLTDIENELTTLNDEIAQQTCTLETSDTTNAAVSEINALSQTFQDYMAGASDQDIELLVEAILDDTTGVAYQLSVIDTALFDEGISDGIIPTCLATLQAPTAGTAGDLAYYEAVSNLTMYFYTIQVQGLNLLVEALHAQAAEAWVDANGISAIEPSDMPYVCWDAPDVTVAEYCNQATGWMTLVYESIQEQFAYAGAPYSTYVSGSTTTFDVETFNGTPYAFVTSLEDVTAAQGSTCSMPLDSSDPCGPLVGTNLTSPIPLTVAYGYRTDWVPATPEAWQALLTGWTDSSQTLGTYLADTWGFQNTTNSTKVFLTDTTYTATPHYSGALADPFSLPAACFGDTSLERSVGHQPFCFNGSNDGDDYGEASDLLDEHWLSSPNQGCANLYAPSELTDEDTDGFYDGTYAVALEGYSCPYDGWEDGDQPGWILDAEGESGQQYLWPMFDMSTAVCDDNENGSERSTTNAVGVYTMCGADFDAWFATIVPDPADNVPTTTTTSSTTSTTVAPAPTATISPSTGLSAGDQVTVTSAGWDGGTDLTTSLYSTPTVLDRWHVDGGGRLSRTVTIPRDTEPGSHAFHLDGTYRGSPHTVTIDVTIEAPAATGTLPRTGLPIAVPIVIAMFLVLIGTALVLSVRRRR
jgi:hypothetical protein